MSQLGMPMHAAKHCHTMSDHVSSTKTGYNPLWKPCTFEDTVLRSSNNRRINLYSDNTENKLYTGIKLNGYILQMQSTTKMQVTPIHSP